MRILIVDDHPLMVEMLSAIAGKVFADPELLVAGNLQDALAQAQRLDALDLVLLDLGLPGCSGIDALTALRNALPETRVVIVSATEDRSSVLSALAAGAAAYIPKTHPMPLTCAVLRLVADGGRYVPPQALGDEAEKQEVTERQLDVLRLIVKGLSNKQIGQRLRIAEDTVKQHAKAVYAALRIGSRSEAGPAAERRGIKLD